MKMIISKLTIALLFTAWLMSYSFAEDRALFIGLSEYSEPSQNLMGPNVDIQLMVDIAERLGFERSQMRMLLNENATRQNILREMRTWLVRGVQPGDRVLIYYTGHGARVADSRDTDDGCDEALVPYGGFASAITGNDIDAALADSQAAEMLFIVDSCFSGNLIDTTRGHKSVHRSLGGRQAKTYNGLDEDNLVCNIAANDLWSNKSAFNDPWSDKSTFRDIGLSAADTPEFSEHVVNRSLFMSASSNNEVALGALNEQTGSLFTQNLFDELEGNNDITFNVLASSVKAAMAEELENSQRFITPTPTIAGPAEWQSQNFYDFGSWTSKGVAIMQNPSARTIETTLNGLKSNSAFTVDVTSAKRSLRLGEELVFDVYSEKAGYLYVYDHGASGNLTLLFPNDFAPEPYPIRANETIRLPGALISFKFPAVEPVGTSRIVAIVSNKRLSANQNLICNFSGGFGFCSGSSSRDIGVMEKSAKDFISAATTTQDAFGFGEEYVTVTY